MTAGYSGSYAINGTNFLLQPTTGRWFPPNAVGYDGNGRAIYPPLREFEIKWDFIDAASANQIKTFVLSIGATGSVIVDLPKYMASTYLFESYTGCHLNEPELDVYFEEHTSNMMLLVTSIRT